MKAPIPLVIDLDGTLLRSDLLLESGLAFIRHHPAQILRPLVWLTQGKAFLKEQLARQTTIDATTLPYDPEVLALIQQAKQDGRAVVLATASHHLLAEAVAAHLGCFDEVMATRDGENLSAHRKRDRLLARFGEQGFDYAGNSAADLPVWAAAKQPWLVNPPRGVEKRARAQGNIAGILRRPAPGLRDWRDAIRLHQWAKNTLLFVPLLAAHQLTQLHLLFQGLLAFVLFGLCASSVYVLNDLLDLGDDRHHRSKRNRPFASGRLPLGAGLLAFPLLLMTAFGGAALLSGPFLAILAAYYLLTLSYTLWLKRIMAVDVILLAMLYTTRIVAGVAAMQLPLTFWMLAFSMFLFLSLALLKRHTELAETRTDGIQEKPRGRGYYPDDLEMISSLGAASGYLSVLVLALYIHEPETAAAYSNPALIWLACPLLLLWITRTWMLSHRGEMHDDPVVFALFDRTSQIIGLLFVSVFWIAV